MARPKIKGLLYFPFDIDFFEDNKIRIVKARYRSDGVMIYLFLLCEIYRQGYYIKADEDFLYIISDELGIDQNKVKQVLNFLLNKSLFDNTLFSSDKVFQKTLNLLLTAEIDNEEWKPVLESLGVECTLESALLMAQIKAALSGDTQAAKFVAQYSGQSNRTEEDLENKKAETELIKARKESITGENENNDALDRLDQILKEVRDNAFKQETE